MTRWLVGAGALLLGALYVIDAVSFRQEPVRGIDVVGTWEELLDTEAITLRNGLRVHVGLESLTSSVNEGVLVYVLVEEYPIDLPTDGAGATRSLPLGPVFLTLDPPWDEHAGWDSETPRKLGTMYYLYAQAIASPRVGRRTVLVWDGVPDGEQHGTPLLIAHGGVSFVDDGQGAWVALQNPSGASHGPLRNVNGPAGLPLIQGVNAACDHQRRPRLRGRPLVRLVPSDPDPELRLRRTEQGIAIESTGPKLQVGWPECRLLVRFTVNGRVPPTDSAPVLVGPIRDPPEDWKRHLGFELDWGFEALGAGPGDEVTMEALWCPSGWVPLSLLAGYPHRPEPLEGSRKPRRTNRVTTRVP